MGKKPQFSLGDAIPDARSKRFRLVKLDFLSLILPCLKETLQMYPVKSASTLTTAGLGSLTSLPCHSSSSQVWIMVYFGALCTAEISVVLTEVRWPQEAPITAHPLRHQGNLKRRASDGRRFLWSSIPDRCLAAKALLGRYKCGVNIWMFFLAYDSELRCSQEIEKENGLSCFTTFCKGWWIVMMRLGWGSGQSHQYTAVQKKAEKASFSDHANHTFQIFPLSW